MSGLKIRATRRHLFSKWIEGHVLNSIVSSQKHGFTVTMKNTGHGIYKRTIIEWQHSLAIDLWFVVLRIDWKTKDK